MMLRPLYTKHIGTHCFGDPDTVGTIRIRQDGTDYVMEVYAGGDVWNEMERKGL